MSVPIICVTKEDYNDNFGNVMWPASLPCVPSRGELMESITKHAIGNKQKPITLEIYSVTWKYNSDYGHCYAEVLLGSKISPQSSFADIIEGGGGGCGIG